MKILTLFLNAMRLTNMIDCRRFAVDPAYQHALQAELCRNVVPARLVREAAGGKTAGETVWRTA